MDDVRYEELFRLGADEKVHQSLDVFELDEFQRRLASDPRNLTHRVPWVVIRDGAPRVCPHAIPQVNIGHVKKLDREWRAANDSWAGEPTADLALMWVGDQGPEFPISQRCDYPACGCFAVAAAAEGPFPPDGFRWEGTEYHGLPPLAWRLLNHLWNQANQTASFESLVGPVWQDHQDAVDAVIFGGQRKEVNNWMKANCIPFKVASKGNHAILRKNGNG